jgi:YD repeat-containing protein
VTATVDSAGKTVTRLWCNCGGLNTLIDANGTETSWERDLQGRITKEVRANGSEWLYEYEQATSRLKKVTDPKEQVRTYTYFLDDNLEGVSYTNEEHNTPDVTFTYETAFNRVSTMEDGTGTTTYQYYPIGSTPPSGAGKLASVDGPTSNDTITYGYDEFSRIERISLNNNKPSIKTFDSLGRLTSVGGALGTFVFEYESTSNRISRFMYPNGQISQYTFYPNIGDSRLQEIHHRDPSGATLWKFNYAYDPVERILTWTQQQSTDPATVYDFQYDRSDQLRTAVWRTAEQTPTILKRYGYGYDSSGNRTVEQLDNGPVLSAYDNMNRLSSQSPGGTMHFAGTLNEAATVTIQGAPATVTSDNKFQGGAHVTSGTNQVVLKTNDYAGNERTNTYEVSVSGGTQTFAFDANGNMTGDGSRNLEWDAENRLVAVDDGTVRTEFSYDGAGRRVRIVEKTNGDITSDLRYVWTSNKAGEERDAAGVTRKRFSSYGFEDQGTTYFYLKDHLGSVRGLTDAE